MAMLAPVGNLIVHSESMVVNLSKRVQVRDSSPSPDSLLARVVGWHCLRNGPYSRSPGMWRKFSVNRYHSLLMRLLEPSLDLAPGG
jgi:hypothetical protein